MNIIKLLKDQDHQFIDLPQAYQIEGEEAYIKKIGNVILLIPKHNPWQTLLILWNSENNPLSQSVRNSLNEVFTRY